ncbi:unnamed protein product [Prunus armeniaca]
MAAVAAGPDHLFNLRNNFYLGAYQAAINNSELPNLSPDDAVERDCLVFRSYIALGSYQLVINEIDASAATPLQAVKLLALYLSGPDYRESAISSLKELLADPGIGNNSILRLIAGTVFMHEQDYNEALKHTNAGGTMELNALNIQIFLKMHRSDYAERQLRVMQQVDEDHTLTQLANAWLNLAVVIKYFLFHFSSSCRLDIIVHFCNFTFFEIRVVQRYRRHISSSKISLRSLRLQV